MTKEPVPYSPEVRNIIRALERIERPPYRATYGELDLVVEIAQRLQALETLATIAEEHRQFQDYHRYSKRVASNQRNLESASRAYERKTSQNGSSA